MRRRLTACAVVSSLALSLAGCIGLLWHPEPPRFTVADVSLVGGALFEQHYRVRLRVQNPNDRALAIRGLDYELRLNDRPFATGVSSAAVTLPANGVEFVDLDAFSGLQELLGQLAEVGRRRSATFHYRLKGHVTLLSPAVALPFDHSGEFSLLPPPDSKAI